MEKIIIGDIEYHVPAINLDQIDEMLIIFPTFMSIVQSPQFDASSQSHYIWALLKALEDAPLKRIVETLLVPVDRDYWQKSDGVENAKFVGRIQSKMVCSTDATGNIIPGVILESFFGNNPDFKRLWDNYQSSLSLAIQPKLNLPDSPNMVKSTVSVSEIK